MKKIQNSAESTREFHQLVKKVLLHFICICIYATVNNSDLHFNHLVVVMAYYIRYYLFTVSHVLAGPQLSLIRDFDPFMTT